MIGDVGKPIEILNVQTSDGSLETAKKGLPLPARFWRKSANNHAYPCPGKTFWSPWNAEVLMPCRG